MAKQPQLGSADRRVLSVPTAGNRLRRPPSAPPVQRSAAVVRARPFRPAPPVPVAANGRGMVWPMVCVALLLAVAMVSALVLVVRYPDGLHPKAARPVGTVTRVSRLANAMPLTPVETHVEASASHLGSPGSHEPAAKPAAAKPEESAAPAVAKTATAKPKASTADSAQESTAVSGRPKAPAVLPGEPSESGPAVLPGLPNPAGNAATGNAATCSAAKQSSDGITYHTYGTHVKFVDDPTVAAKLALQQNKLLFVMHIAGNFEDKCFT
jgi:hypothetical protein